MVISPGCARRSESTYTRRSANRTRAAPESTSEPATSDCPTTMLTVPAGGTALSPSTVPASVTFSRDIGAASIQRFRFTSRTRTFRSRAP